MLHTDDRFSTAVEARVADIETRTDAELVVVAAERSGHYRDITARVGAAGALLVCAFLLWIPHLIAEPWFLLDLVLTYVFFEWLSRSRRIVRLLTREERRAEQARLAAEREFHHEAVHGTARRIGVLVYVSALEGIVEVVPDLGIQGRVPGGEMIGAVEAFHHDDLDHFLTGLDALGEVLARYVPATDHPDAIDLPNAPRVRT